MNSVQILGNLARDPEVRFTKTGRAVATFTVAATNTYFDSITNEQKEQTAFINCVAWGKLGEAAGNLRKGSRCFVEGRLNTRSYETQDGQKRYVTEVVANFVGQSLDAQNADSFGGGSSNFDSFGGGNEENIPF
ncbi:single-stranded DNA-binding protein [Veillonella sp. R32]|uniref:single-stranded DNA-binding protein n=1 Tax=Veillonella sp. R32 TaxID=2021312 RepID=UPI00138954BE|nr:single-stranded DNA-binding protein [Veillonella sp. R32]KAF1680737.1 single-stranded DNA-binding protein [Veillonella sp. R32]